MTRFLAAAIQMNSQPDLARNMDQTADFVARAAREGARFVALPENFAFLGSEKEKHRQTEQIADAVQTGIPALAREHGVYLLAGGFPMRSPDDRRAFNRSILFDPSGTEIARYDKIHLFDIELSGEESYRESALVRPGRPKPVVCDINLKEPTRAFRVDERVPREGSEATSGPKAADEREPAGEPVCVGLSICYDVRFPELYRQLSGKGADLLCVPSAFTRPTGEAHWETLLRARAIENISYVIAPAQTGVHGRKRKTHGHSMIIDPWGTVLADAGTETGIIYAKIDTGHLQAIRRRLPSLDHRRL
ncbi:MAG: carbon-nitrogen hydrolase family protein [Cyclonatronaceae bacterium]